MTRVAVVTGANKGIGFGIVKRLCKEFDGDVYLTARDVGRGTEATEKLKAEGLNPKFHQLDIISETSVEKLKTFLEMKYGGLDLLINNAAIGFLNDSPVPFAEQVEPTISINFWGTLTVCNALFPMLRSHARVVFVSSVSALVALDKVDDDYQFKYLASLTHPKDPREYISVRSVSKDICRHLTTSSTVKEVEKYMTQFQDAAKNGTHKEMGWSENPYGISKAGVTIMTSIQQNMMDKDKGRTDIVINACCPGAVLTDMNKKGNRTIEEGIDTPMYLAMLPPNVDSPRGEHVFDRRIMKWN